MTQLNLTLDDASEPGMPGLSAAMAIVTQALRDDPGYAWAWHCNLTMMAQDAGCARAIADEGSARFLELLADVDIRQHAYFPRFETIMPTPASCVKRAVQNDV